MKVMFVSDVHGKTDNLETILDIYYKEKPNKIIFLGDMYYGSYDDDMINHLLDRFIDKYIIKGNCDSELDNFLEYYIFDEFGKRFFCTHGNRYNKDRYPEEEFDVLVQGHTHIGLIEEYNNKLFLNPGSISYPRGGSDKSYMIIDDKGIYLKDLEQNIIDKLMWKK